MIIHLPGLGQKPPTLWWVGRRATCPVCRSEFELEYEDRHAVVVFEQHNVPHLEVACPTQYCNQVMWLYKDPSIPDQSVVHIKQ